MYNIIELKYHPYHILIRVIFMLNDKGPLMFINTVNTDVNEIPQQKVYDSRNHKPRIHTNEPTKETATNQIGKIEENLRSLSEENVEENPPSIKLNFLEERKLNNIIEMYNKNRPVLCNIICGEKELVGIPFKKDYNKLYVKTSEENVEEVSLNDITDIVIIKF
jgi:hypothetical protein